MAASQLALGHQPPSGVSSRAQRDEIQHIVAENWIGKQRSLLASLNKFRYWSPAQVKAVFQLLPPAADRKLSPLGPEFRILSSGSQRWKELGAKVSLLGPVDSLAQDRGGSEETECRCHFVVLLCEAFSAADAGSCTIGQGTLRQQMGAIPHTGFRGLQHAPFHSYHGASLQMRFRMDLVRLDSHPDDASDPASARAEKHDHKQPLSHVQECRSCDHPGFPNSIAQLGGSFRDSSGSILRPLADKSLDIPEVKIAYKALVVTATHIIDFAEMVNALEQQEAVDYWRWHELRLTFARLLHTDKGISLTDIALSCQNRTTTNEIDYARGFFALLELKWQTGWSYTDGVLEIIRSQPYHAGRIAAMHGTRGLPPPYSCVPKYLVLLEGVIRDGFTCSDSGLFGYWYTVPVKQVLQVGLSKDEEKPLFNLAVLDKNGKEVEIQTTLAAGLRREPIEKWGTEDVPSGKARLLCADNPVAGEHAHVLLLATQTAGRSDGLELDGCATVTASGMLNYGGVEVEMLKWWLS